jgi:protein-disulfide isomerase
MAELRFPINEFDHVLGQATAPVTLVEYGDYQCPHCQAAQPHIEVVLREFGRDLRFAYRHFPLATVHPMARPAAEAAEFAGAHGRFWQMHSALFANGARLSDAVILALAAQLALDPAELRAALVQGIYAPKVEADFAGGVRSGVNGTPCFFINGRRHDGSWDARTLSAAIETTRKDARMQTIPIEVG